MNLKKIIVLFIFSLPMFSSFAQEITTNAEHISNAKQSVAIIKIEGMACQEGCADKISENLKATDGITNAEVSFEEKQGIITFDPQHITIEAITNVITSTKVKNYNYSIKEIKIKE